MRMDQAHRLSLATRYCLDILAKDPGNFEALNNLSNIFYVQEKWPETQRICEEIVKLYPENTAAHVNLAHALREDGKLRAARERYEIALRLDPTDRGAHVGMIYILVLMGEDEAAQVHRRAAYEGAAARIPATYGKDFRIPMLVLISGDGGDVPYKKLLNFHAFHVATLAVEFHDADAPLPPHRLVFNAVGDADRSPASLQAAIRALARTSAPVINSPAAVLATGRVANAARLSRIPGVKTARMALLPRELLTVPEADPSLPPALAAHGLAFPLLLRAPGFHAGLNFVRVENPAELAAALPTLPGRELLAIEYFDTRKADGKVRKYRVMMIDGKLYPLHAAVSGQWKVHFFSAEMGDSPEHRAEDQAFLDDMPQVLGEKAMGALQAIQAELELDYGGIDFSLDADGNVLLFEANANMRVDRPKPGALWDYRRKPVERIFTAVLAMLRERASSSSPGA